MEDVLMRMQRFPSVHNDGPAIQPGHKWFNKMRAGDLLKARRCIFMAEQPANSSSRSCDIPNTDRDGQPKFPVDFQECLMVWLGKGDYPYKLPKGIDVVKEREVWEKAKGLWIKKHPRCARFDDDPKPVPTQPEEPEPEPVPEVYEVVLAEGEMLVDTHLDGFLEAGIMLVEVEGASMEAMVVWTERGLHFGFRVWDKSLNVDTLGVPWGKDSIQVFIDPTGDGGDSMSGEDFQIVVTPQGRLWIGLFEDVGFECEAAIDEDNYTVEFVVPWTAVEFNRDNLRIGVALQNGEDAAMYGGHTTNFKSPNKWMQATCVQ
jgi:hypothetical protein